MVIVKNLLITLHCCFKYTNSLSYQNANDIMLQNTSKTFMFQLKNILSVTKVTCRDQAFTFNENSRTKVIYLSRNKQQLIEWMESAEQSKLRPEGSQLSRCPPNHFSRQNNGRLLMHISRNIS